MLRSIEELTALFVSNLFNTKSDDDLKSEELVNDEIISFKECYESLNCEKMVEINVPGIAAQQTNDAEAVHEHKEEKTLEEVVSCSEDSYSKKHSRNNWSTLEQKQLMDIKNANEYASWKEIAEHIYGKTPKQCCQQWHRVILAEKKGRWSSEEDDSLLKEYASSEEIKISGRSQLEIRNRLSILIKK